MIHDALYDYLRGDPDFAQMFGERIFHEWIPQTQTAFPALSFTLTSDQEVGDDMDDPDETVDMQQANYQFDVWGRSSADAITTGDRFHRIFKRLRGRMGAVNVQHVEISNRQHLGEQVGDKERRRVSIDYRIYFNEIEA